MPNFTLFLYINHSVNKFSKVETRLQSNNAFAREQRSHNQSKDSDQPIQERLSHKENRQFDVDVKHKATTNIKPHALKK